MIYFTEEAKDKLYHKFSASLRPGGYLFVGSTEQIFTPSKYGFESTETFFIVKITLARRCPNTCSARYTFSRIQRY